jgi:hypothetical protein
MKLKYYFILLSILLIGIVCIAGCTSSTSTPAATPTPQIVYVTVLVTQTPASQPSLQTTSGSAEIPTANPTEQLAYTTDQINKHFIDVAFSSDYQNVVRWSALVVKDSVTGAYTPNDEMIISNISQQFNEYSTTTQLPSKPTEGIEGNIVINFLPTSSLQTLTADVSYNSVNQKQVINKDASGTVASIYRVTGPTWTVYINSDLTGDERTHYIVRGLLYTLGFVGQTGTYPDSIFYSAPNTITTPNIIDWDVIQLMYGNKISAGMNLTDVENILLIINKNPT